MKKVININFQGRVVPIEESAYDILKKYVESLTRFFANEEGKDEIINDIESRIAELFGETLKKGSTCITDDDVNVIIASMGRPEDFEGEEANVKSQLGGEPKQEQQQNSYQQNFTYAANEPRRLFRDENHKAIGGVCSGIANYFGVDRVVIRILAIIFFGVVFVPYLIVWVAVPSTAAQVIGSQRKRLFRDTDDKIIAGVCSGLAQYFGVSIWIPRLLFLIPFFSFAFGFRHWSWFGMPHFLSLSFSPGALFIYIILWLVLPEAKTTAEKLEMKGEKVDLNSIKTTIQNDMEGFGKRAEQWGKEFSTKAQEMGQTLGQKGKQFSSEATTVARKHSRGFGDIIILIVKIFAYFILGVILLSVACALFGIGVTMTGLMPAWSYIINDGWQTVLAWGTLILFIWVPVIGIVTYIIRRLMGKRANSNVIGFTFGGLWTIGWFCVICLIASLSQEFRSKNNPLPEVVALSNPKVNRLEIKVERPDNDDEDNWLKLTPFASFEGDTVYVQNIKVRIVKSTNDSFNVSVKKYSRGEDRNSANELATKINYSITQTDSTLNLGKGIAINHKDKFRNQHVLITVAVPVGKRFILTDRNNWRGHVRVDFGSDDYEWNSYEWDNGNGTSSLSYNVEYIMGDKKIERTSRLKHSDDNDNTNDDENNAVEQYKKSREDLQKQYEDAAKDAAEKKRKAEELKKELDKPVVDSNRYHYQQEKPVKPSDKKVAITDTKKASIDYPISMQSLLMARFI